MKKIKSLLIIAVLMVTATWIKAETVSAAATASNFNIICEKEKMNFEDTSKCYVIAQVTPEGNAGLHGVVAITSTKNLQIINAETALRNVGAETIDNGATSKLVQALGNGQTYTCRNNAGKCYAFISSTSTGAILLNGTTNGIPAVDNNTSYSGYTVIGWFNVKLAESAGTTQKDCGQICINPNFYASATSYTGVASGDSQNPCAFIYPVDTVTVTPSNTGSFASYAILAAGAFIAISAVAIAKKHNKFYKV